MAYHACDVPYLFRVLNASDPQYQLNSAAEVALSTAFLDYVARYIEKNFVAGTD